ncbi:hypothetical protein M8A51_16430 [Schlegelella sp. S2-27]|uniref:Uncharacterized protein n=1 Tax=Caldimonas mangrovi TaxID=2944811 RepID=A0ABT0YQV4_9BURK|nr:hypothetical protein [Caldimonas mangrovi]MCM5681114.1 hypothetical protein [Caldimonas mangrovi]
MPARHAASAPAAQGASRLASATPDEVLKASRAFDKLRNLRGHFSGARWSAEVDAWEGELHRAMQVLAAWSAQQRLQAGALKQLMGAPDETTSCTDDSCDATLRSLKWPGERMPPVAKQSTELWIYHWRGGRDRLVIVMKDARVGAAGWDYLGE